MTQSRTTARLARRASAASSALRRAACLAACVLAASCTPDEPAPTPPRSSASAGTAVETVALALTAIDADVDHVDGRGADVLLGVDEVAPGHSDAAPEMVVQWMHGADAIEPPWGTEAIADARLVDDGRVVWLSGSGVVHTSTRSGETEVVAHDAHAPIGVSPSGRYVTWVAGDLPEVDVRRWDRATGAIDPIAPTDVPSWSPVPFDDGAVAWVAVRDSLPQRVRADADGVVTVQSTWTTLEAVGVFATGPGAPVMVDGHVIARAGDQVAAWAGDPTPVWTRPGERVARMGETLLVRGPQGWVEVDPRTGDEVNP